MESIKLVMYHIIWVNEFLFKNNWVFLSYVVNKLLLFSL